MSLVSVLRNYFGKLKKGNAGFLLLVAMLMAVASLLLFGWLSEEVLEGDAKRFDELVRTTVHGFASPALTHVMQGLSLLGSVAVTVVLTLLALILLYYFQRRRAAVFLGIVMVGAGVLDVVLKQAFHRARPTPYFGIAPASYSFPSGHALGALCFYGALAIIFSGPASRATRFVIWAFAILLIAGIGLSRIYLGVHYPSDVAAGYSAAIVWVGTVYVIDKLFGATPVKGPDASASAQPV